MKQIAAYVLLMVGIGGGGYIASQSARSRRDFMF